MFQLKHATRGLRIPFLGLISCLFLSCSDSETLSPFGKKLGQSDQIEEAMRYLAALPKEDILKNEDVVRARKEHKIYVSVTTSPLRLRNFSKHTMRTLNLEQIDKVIVVLPEKFKDSEEYNPEEIKQLKNEFEKIEILRSTKDLGPITKLIPAVEYARARGEKAIIITIDDDMGYPVGHFGQLIKYALRFNAVVGSSGQRLTLWKMDVRLWPDNVACPYSTLDPALWCPNVLEGYGAVAYHSETVPVEELKILNGLSKACKFSDDLVISYAMTRNKIPMLSVSNSYISAARIVMFQYGFASDALHRGAQYLGEEASGDMNYMKYEQCLKTIKENVRE